MKVDVNEAVSRLVEARRQHVRVPAPELPDTEAAYAVQAGVAKALDWFGQGPARHWKSGGASRDVPLTHAPLPPTGVWQSPADASEWPFWWRGIEIEIALRLGSDVDAAQAARLDLDGARALVDRMCVAIEIVDSRWVEARSAPTLAKLADLQSHGALVLGAWVDYADRDWTQQRCQVRVGEQAAQAFRGSHSLNDPVYVLPQWLRHATQGGAVLAAGTVVTTGTWCGLLQAQAGDAVEAGFEGIGTVRVQL
jgi:2-keto-4-pentenoate hydratase